MNIKKIFGFSIVLTIAALAIWNVSLGSKKSDLSGINLANIEALAGGESTENTCNWASREVYNGWEAICIVGGPGYSCTCGSTILYPNT
jgi:hypothetical protein